MIPAYNKKRCAAFPFETGIHFRRKTDFFPEERAAVAQWLSAPAFKSVISMAKINELKFELHLPHAPYSPDFAPYDYFLFQNLKKWLSGQRFSNDEEMLSAVNDYFEEQGSSYFKKGSLNFALLQLCNADIQKYTIMHTGVTLTLNSPAPYMEEEDLEMQGLIQRQKYLKNDLTQQ
ncbi:histone-lysine N-methyltransferase SETMAR [Trichonephila clavipes]|uniref:Histone-lysine N-methyltransferase SETMAR n=1 Tax=Trichonephila clavipes TaxID=2585209 RepID=A0A8X6WDU1_TRICX|nr:histone-lysine N-methyltransferase SETMAR [Trichonephila clavipes]